MSRVEAAAADRLPWLTDEPQSQPAERPGNPHWPWAAAAVVSVAALGFWMGTRSAQDQPAPAARSAPPSTTVRLPELAPAESQVRLPAEPEVRPAPEPQVRPAPVREVRIAVPPAHQPKEQQAPVLQDEAARSAAAVQQASPSLIAQPNAAPAAWPPRLVAGAAGRLVQIGAFGSPHQAKRGWWFMVSSYPAMTHLPAVVTAAHNLKGQPFYRVRLGTTSQAHSEVLCQRMQRIGLSCTVIGLPRKAKVDR
jgi:hypothetical protein